MKKGVRVSRELKEQYMQYFNFIQNVINRNNSNSFQIKTFAITIFSAITAIYISSQIVCIYFISLVATLILWLLDATYLLQEKRYRKLYDEAVEYKAKVYSMNTNKYKNSKRDFINTVLSKTIAPLYIILLILQLIVIFVRCND